MRSLLHQLENNEAVLMMYLADELPPQDRAEVEQMLATDGGLRADLDRLAEAQGSVEAALSRLDSNGPKLPSEGVAVRRVGRAIAQWHADRLAAPVQMPLAHRGGFPRWGIAVGAAAACVLISALVWWASDSSDGRPGAGQVSRVIPIESDPEGVVEPQPLAVIPATADRDAFLLPVDDVGAATQGSGGSGGGGLAWADRYDQLERELSAISTEGDTSTFFSDP